MGRKSLSKKYSSTVVYSDYIPYLLEPIEKYWKNTISKKSSIDIPQKKLLLYFPYTFSLREKVNVALQHKTTEDEYLFQSL